MVSFLLVLLLGPGPGTAPRIEPRDEWIAGIHVSALHETWVRVSPIRAEDAVHDAEGMKKNDWHRDLETDLDGDGVRERALTGVYADNRGKTGSFLLLLKKKGDAWRKWAVYSFQGEPRISFVGDGSYGIEWVWCMECDSFSCLIAKNKPLKLECTSCCEVD